MRNTELRKKLEICLEKLKTKENLQYFYLELKRKMAVVGKIYFNNKEAIDNLIVNEGLSGAYIYIHTDNLDSYILFDDCYIVETIILGGK